jgi:hypothetical protein
MIELRSGLHLVQEPFWSNRLRDLRMKDFHRDLSLVFQVLREVDGGHATTTQFTLDRVAILECGVQSAQYVSHKLRPRFQVQSS